MARVKVKALREHSAEICTCVRRHVQVAHNIKCTNKPKLNPFTGTCKIKTSVLHMDVRMRYVYFYVNAR